MIAFANLFAVHAADPRAQHALARDLLESREFTEVCKPCNGWTLALAPLPRAGPRGSGTPAASRPPQTGADRETASRHGVAFAEGRDAVRSALTGRDEPERWLADRLLHAPEELGKLPGDFGLVRLAAHGEAVVVRSCAGLVPLYLFAGPEYVAVGTRLGDFVRFLPHAPRLDPLVNACWAAGELVFPDDRTFLRDISIVPRGCFARVRAGRTTIGRYWDPRPPSLAPARPREHAERLRAILLEQLSEGLDPRGGNLLLLSGGVDSSALAALARRALNLPLMTLSFLPEEGHPGRAREQAFLDDLNEELGFTRRWQLPFSRSRYLGLIARAPRVVFHVLHPALGVIAELTQEADIRTVCGGEFADEVCGSALVMADWAYHTDFRGLVASAGAWPTGPKDLGRWVKHRALRRSGIPRWPPDRDLPDLIAPDIRAEYRAWQTRMLSEALHDVRPRATLAAYAAISNWNVMNWEALSPLGIRRSFPFFNRAVLELAFACHPAELFGPGMKTLLRRAVSDLVPPRNLFRQDKGQWGHRSRDWVSGPPTVDESVSPILQNGWIERHRLRMEWRELKVIESLVLFHRNLSERRAERRPPADLTLDFR